MPLIINPDPHLARHVAEAIGRHRAWLARQYVREPIGLREVQESFSSSASGGQAGTALDDLAQPGEAEAVPRLLITYEEAAAAMSISIRTVKRLVADGQLAPVRIGGLARLRVDAVEAFVAGLSDSDQTQKDSA